MLLRELCEAAGRETCPSSDVLSRLCLYERIDDEGVARKMWALSGGDPERLRSCASKALKEGLVKGSEGMIEDPLAIEGAGLRYARVRGRLDFEAGAPREPEEPPKMFKLDDAAIEKWIRGQKISTDSKPSAAAARRAWLLRKAGGAANAALQARRMFAKARAVQATGDVHLGTAAERQCRRLERRLVRKERKERIKRARAALALDGGLDADEADVEVVNALARYGAGGLQRPLKEKDKIRIKSWGHGLLKILEREADSDDDDGGVEGTETKFEAVRNVEAEVVAPLELVVFDGAEPRAESAYVVKAEQVVRFEVRPANADGESGTRDPGRSGKKRDDRKRKDEKKKADERQTAERQARKAIRAKHAVGARVVLDPEIVQKYGSRDTLTEDCWGTITRIDGERARVAWDAGTPEARSGKTSFPLDVTAPRIIGRGATVLRAEIRDVAELGA